MWLILHIPSAVAANITDPAACSGTEVVLDADQTFDNVDITCNGTVSITSNSTVAVINNANVIFQAQWVSLQPVFSVETGSTLKITTAEPLVTTAVSEALFAGNQEYRVFAANDLGMHCADLDYQIFSILPPFNVIHAQVIKKGKKPSLLTPGTAPDISVVYSATSNPNDPVFDPNNPTMPAALNPPASSLAGTERASVSINSTSQNDATAGVFKSNFWKKNPFTANPFGFDGYDNIFFGLLSPLAVILDTGLPVPDSLLLPDCLSTPATCQFMQQIMPGIAGIAGKYLLNDPKPFNRFDEDVNFFSSVLAAPTGSIIEGANWWSADGVPMFPKDDAGRWNAYPMMRIQALNSSTVVASTDIVLPVASEADCQNCHALTLDCADPDLSPLIRSDSCTQAAVSPTRFSKTVFDVASLDDPAPGDTRNQQLLNAAKINILRLHDVKHGAKYPAAWGSCDASAAPENANNWNGNCLAKRTPIQCSQCHYSPALDLAQLGPTDDVASQVFQKAVGTSMSSVMHKFHSQYGALFPDMPPPDDTTRNKPAVDHGYPDADPKQSVKEYVLQETCYQCHPGKRTQCLRGAMFSGGVVCQDCHGEMADVGHDFTSGGTRVPWASEPKCQSCHTGDAGRPNHPSGAIVADDGIRLLQAYVNDANAPIASPNSRFAENENLYRLSGNEKTLQFSQGHKGVMCEGCHGSTHAIWPIDYPFANDNIAATQLQGHKGSIIQCSTCHTGDLGLTLQGPHGLHPVAPISMYSGQPDTGVDITVWNRDHKDADRTLCQNCHGKDGLGTVLSRAAADRTLACDKLNRNGCQNYNINGKNRKLLFVDKGTEISCDLCHSNKINDD
ncbi:hypothetical protein [Thiolapillus sp.]|uniref:hypothetical protein n=1 Tax=Thiolapillus sp. TaxID=2017437 RepID=UPI003AF82796